MRIYKQLSKKEKEKIMKSISEILKKEGIKGCVVFGSFLTRKYFRDIDIALLAKKINEDKLLKLALSLEKIIGIEVDLKIFDHMPDSVKFEALTKGKILFGRKFFKNRYKFVNIYIDFVEWLKKWV